MSLRYRRVMSSYKKAAGICDKTGLIAWWTMDETSGTRYDSHGNNDLATSGTTNYAIGKVGNGADFEKTDDSNILICSDNDNISLGGTDFTIGYWLYLESESATFDFHISKRDGSVYEFAIGYQDGASHNIRKMSMAVYHNGEDGTTKMVSSAGNAVNAGEWHYITGTFNNTTKLMQLYIDAGTPTTETATGITIANTTSDLYVGALGNSPGAENYRTDGILDEICIFKRVLTAGEITWLYNSGDGRTYTDL